MGVQDERIERYQKLVDQGDTNYIPQLEQAIAERRALAEGAKMPANGNVPESSASAPATRAAAGEATGEATAAPTNDDQRQTAPTAKIIPFEPAKPSSNAMVLQAKNYDLTRLHVIQVEHRGRKPVNSNWQHERLTPDGIGAVFSRDPTPNVGIVTGESSVGICDIDFDWQMAPIIGADFFARFPAFGRPGKPMSHRLFKVPAGEPIGEIVQFVLPDSPCVKSRVPDDHALCVMEVRGSKHMTIFPPSIHKSGEPISWSSPSGFEMPPEYEWKGIVENAGLCAFLTVMAAWYPAEGVRNEFSLALGGALLRVMEKDYKDKDDVLIANVDGLVQLVCKAGGDQGRGRSWTDRAQETLTKMRNGSRVSGLPKVCELLGLDMEVERRFRQWLGAEADDRPIIVSDPNKLHEVLDKAQRALVDSDASVYRQGKRLLYLGHLNEENGEPKKDRFGNDGIDTGDGIWRPLGAASMFEYEETFLYEEINRVANWKDIIYPKKGPPKIGKARHGAPRGIAGGVLKRPHLWRDIPILNGVIHTPTILGDGSLLTTPGYHRASGLLLDTGGVAYAPIPDSPTKDDAIAALKVLLEPFEEFKFEGMMSGVEIDGAGATPSRSVALSNCLTAVSRKSMLYAPIHGFDAPVQASGKGKAVKVAATMALGHAVPVLSWSKYEEENEKRLAGCLLGGDLMISIDNAEHPIGGTLLNQMFTEETVQVRILGVTGQHVVGTQLLVDATGNGLTFEGDMTSRAIVARIDHGVEDPSKLHFKRDLDTWLPLNRTRLVVAALTVLRAYVVAGRPWPSGLDNSRFKEWNELVRGALIWLDQPDPMYTAERVRALDPVSRDLAQFMQVIIDGAEYGLEVGKPFGTQHLLTQSQYHAPLRDALEAALAPNKINAKQISSYLARKDGAIVRGHRLERLDDKHAGSTKFRLVKLDG